MKKRQDTKFSAGTRREKETYVAKKSFAKKPELAEKESGYESVS